MGRRWKRLWRYGRALIIPLVLWGAVAITLQVPIRAWLEGSESNDREVLREWLTEARGFRDTLPAMVERYVQKKKQKDPLLYLERKRIEEHLSSLGEVITRMYSSQLPLFPTIYRVEIRFGQEHKTAPIVWDSQVPYDETQSRQLSHRISRDAVVHLSYQLHAFDKRQREKEIRAERARNLSLLAVLATGLALGWVIYQQHRERERERQRQQTKQQIDEKERQRLEAELQRQEEEQKRKDAEQDLLQQRLAAQTTERKLLEVKSQLLASIGIMAGSYAHNIKNLLVRPNDLLNRCLDGNSLSSEQAGMLHEVKQTLGTVTERLQQILRTVRRDPSQSELCSVNLGDLLTDLKNTWEEMAWDKWKLQLKLELEEDGLLLPADRSHLQQAIENLLFNARDATFDMRNHLREEARQGHPGDPVAKKQALLEAVAWKGEVSLRAWRKGEEIFLEVKDNGIGMTEEVLEHCTETHFSTKRNDATFEGHGAGMGLGLSFVQVILEHHAATMDIEAEPLRGARFLIRFPTKLPMAQEGISR